MKNYMRIIYVMSVLTLLAIVFAGCAKSLEIDSLRYARYASFRDVPGITEDEVSVIEALQKQTGGFVYGMPLSTEAFKDEDGEVRGFAALLCEWMTELFGIPFRPELYEWLDLLDGLENGKISFSGELTATPERLKIYYMTDAIASRLLKYYRIEGSRPLSDIAGERPLLCGFIEGTSTIDTVISELKPGTFEVVLLKDAGLVYDALKSGEIDVFYYSGTAEANFIEYGDLIAMNFYPLLYRPVSLATRNPAFASIISVMEKILENGGMRHLTTLYNQGHQEYLKYKLYGQLTAQEREYIKTHSSVPAGIDPGNYPGSFYDKREKIWSGIFLDILNEVTALTGLSFERVNDENTEWPEIYQMLIDGDIAVIPELTQSDERAGMFLWSDTALMTDYYVLISRSEYPDIKVNEVLYARVGLARNTAYTDIFNKWFPFHMNTFEYESTEEAFDALVRGDIDMVMANQESLLYLTHYLELPNYKANVVFDLAINVKMAFNRDEAVLQSIVDKALRMFDTNGIAEHWMRKTYDYRSKVVEARLPWLIGAAVLLACVLILLLILFRRTSQEGLRLERQVHERTNEIERQHKLMYAVANNYKGVIWSVDGEGVITTFNGQYLKTIGVEPSFLEGKKLEMARLKNRHLDIIDNVEKTFREGPQDWIGDIDGVVFHSCTTPVYNDSGDIVGIVGSTDNVTEMIKLQRDLETAVEDAKAASRSKSAFLANMSHELRTPLNVIIGLTDLMIEEQGLADSVKENLVSVSNAGGTLLSIVNDILDISKIESGRFGLIPVEYHIPSLLNDTIILLNTYIGEKPIDFKLHISDELPAMLYGDELRVKQIMNNLLSNSVKYTHAGTVELNVECARDGSDVWMDISVKDTGIGIRREELENLFTDYYQADARTNRKTEGTGLGLSIVRRMAQMMDGDVTVDSEYGKGSTFRVRLRQGFVNDIKIGAEVAERLCSFNYSDTKRQTSNKLVRVNLDHASVLVVDDMQNNLDVAAGLMRKYELKVDCLTSGQAAVDRIRDGNPVYNAIFMDHMMPVMDGIETVNAIRALETEYARDVPIIALTANAVSGTEILFIENGFQDFLPKPIDIMQLDAVLKKWVHHQAVEKPTDAVVSPCLPDSISEESDISIEIQGIDAKKGLCLYGGDMGIYLSILRSFADNAPELMNRLRGADMEPLHERVIIAHSLKGSSANICAEHVRTVAAEMEHAARNGDSPGFLTLLEPCIKDTERLVENINAWFEEYDAGNEKPRRISPDREILSRLKKCCEAYDMSGIDKAIEELECSSYDTGADLVAWLREKIDIMEVDEIIERLSKL